MSLAQLIEGGIRKHLLLLCTRRSIDSRQSLTSGDTLQEKHTEAQPSHLRPHECKSYR